MDVTLPNGTIIHDVPDNMTKAELMVKLKANGIDPNAPSTDADNSDDKYASGTEALARGVGQGLTFGQTSRILGGSAALAQAEAGDQDPENFDSSPAAVVSRMNDVTAANDANDKEAQKDHSLLYGIGNIAGSLPAYALGGSIAGVGKGAGLLQNAARGFAGAAPVGAIHGALNSNGTPEDMAKRAALEGLAAGVGGAAAPAVAAGLGAAASAIKPYAAVKTAKALGMLQPQINKYGTTKLEDVGNFAADNGILGRTGLASVGRMAKRTDAINKTANDSLDSVYDQLEDANVGVDPAALDGRLQDIKNDLGPTVTVPGSADNIAANHIDFLRSMLDKFKQEALDSGNNLLPPASVREFKQAITSNTPKQWQANLDVTGQAHAKVPVGRDAHFAVNHEMEDVTGQLDPNDPSQDKFPGLTDMLKNSNDTVHKSIVLSDLLENQANRNARNNVLGLGAQVAAGSVLGGAVGGGAGAGVGALGAGAVAASKALFDRYAPTVYAAGLHNTADALRNVPTGSFPALTGYLAGKNNSADENELDDEAMAQANYDKHFPGN